MGDAASHDVAVGIARCSCSQCGQCDAKDLECTSNYIEQLQSKPRRPRRFKDDRDKEKDKEKDARRSDEDMRASPPAASGSGASSRGSAEDVNGAPQAPASVVAPVPLVDE